MTNCLSGGRTHGEGERREDSPVEAGSQRIVRHLAASECLFRSGDLAFWAAVGNNSVDSVMRLFCRVAIALCLSFPVAGMAAGQDPSGSQNSTGQAQTPLVPKENVPAEQVPAGTTEATPANPRASAPATRAPEGVERKKTNVASGSGTRKRRKRTASAANDAPRKIVVREGGASEPAAQIAPDITPAEAALERRNAEQWLASTDNQLKQLAGRMLGAQQQETMGQIHNYLDGARSALKEGDVQRASTLAQKAYLLSDDLVNTRDGGNTR